MGIEHAELNTPEPYDASSDFLEMSGFEFTRKMNQWKRESVTDVSITLDVDDMESDGRSLKAVMEQAAMKGIKIQATIRGTESQRANIDPNVLASGVTYEVIEDQQKEE